MEPMILQSETNLCTYLKKFLKGKPFAAQLDGSTTAKADRSVVVIFTYSVDGKRYKLAADTTRAAIQEFVRLADEHGSPAVALKEVAGGTPAALTLATTHAGAADGWHCYPYVKKTSDRLRNAA